jgi:thiol-disulfide isomerase/thioredoxin
VVTQANDPQRTRGALRSDQDQLIFQQGFSFSGYERDPIYLNLRNRKFLDISGVTGLDSLSDGRGAVFADFDNDGDLDVFMTTLQGQVHLLFRNNVGGASPFLRLSLEGGAGDGRDAFGAVARVKTSAGILTKVKSGGAGFLSQHDPRLLFGLGPDEQAEWVEVTWPDGEVERFEGEARAGASLSLRRGTGRAQLLQLGRAQLPDPLTPAQSFARSLKIAVGQLVPDLSLKTLAGAATSLRGELRPGRRTIVNVWATWCAPCAREMPELERLRPRLAAQGLDLIGLNVDTEPGTDISGFLASTGAQYRNYVGGVAVVEQLYATDELTVPMSLLLDENGTLIEIIPGWSAESRRRFALLAGTEADP